MSKKQALFFFLCTIAFTLLGQTHFTKHYSLSDNLPSETIRSIFLDSRGLLWVGTDNGLCQYNGVDFKTYNKEDGLAGKDIWAITEDKEGNLWIASYGDGLSKFDGNKFLNFTKDDGLISNSIRSLSVNDSNHLLIGTEEGLSIWNNNQFDNFIIKQEDDTRQVQVMDFFIKNGNQYLMTFIHGLYKINNTNGYSLEKINPFGGIQYIEDNDTYLYLTGGGIFTGNVKEELDYTENINNGGSINKLNNNIIWDNEQIENSTYLASWNVGSPGGGLLRWENGKLENIGITAYGIESEKLWALEYDSFTQVLWIGTLDAGLYSVDLSQAFTAYSYIPFKLDRKDPIKLEIKDIKSRGENIWLLTDEGLIKITDSDTVYFGQAEFKRAKFLWEQPTIQKKQEKKLPSAETTDTEEHISLIYPQIKDVKYSVILGQYKSQPPEKLMNKYLSLKDLRSTQIHEDDGVKTVYFVGEYENKNDAILKQSLLERRKGISNTKIRIIESENGNVKLSNPEDVDRLMELVRKYDLLFLEEGYDKLEKVTNEDALIKRDDQIALTGELKEKAKKINDIKFTSFRFVKNNLYIMTMNGLFKMTVHGHILKYYPNLGPNCLSFEFYNDTELLLPHTYGNFHVYNNLQPKQKTNYNISEQNTPSSIFSSVNTGSKVYLASWEKGLFVYKNNKPTSLFYNNTFKERKIEYIHYDNNKLFIATNQGDVYIANVKDTFIVIDTIPNNQIIGNQITTIESWMDMIILVTNKGLNIFENEKLRFFDEQQGLGNRAFNCSFINDNNLFLFSGEKYYKSILSELSWKDDRSIRPVITKLKINDEIDPKYNFNEFSPCNKTSISLPYNKNDLELTLQLNQLGNQNSIRLYYLDNNKWRAVNNHRIDLRNLSGGKHIIQTKINNLINGAVYEDTLITIIIQKPYWKTIWFWTIILFIISLFIKSIFKNVKAKANLKNQLTKARLEALQSQMNPHFIFNALNSIQNYIIDHKIDDALMYMGNFSKLIRQTLDNSTHYYITISEVIEYLETYIQIENLRFDNTINLEIITSNIDIATITIPPMLIQPLVENSILHGFKNRGEEFKLTITFSKQDKYIKCIIKDNGVGFDVNKKGKSKEFHALEAIKERLLLLQEQKKEELITISSLPEGTTVTLLILYSNAL